MFGAPPQRKKLQHWLKAQEHQEQEKSTLTIIGVSGLFTHILFLVLFIAIDETLMALVNIASVLIWGTSLYTTRSKRYVLSSVLICLEIALHAIIAAHVTGLAAGFQYYLWPAVLLVAVIPNHATRYVLLCLAALLGAIFWVYNFAPISVAHLAELEHKLHMFNLTFATVPYVLSTLVVRFLYQQRFQTVEVMAYRDGLTQLFNRNYTTQRIESFIRTNPNDPLCLILGDIDYFKSINDSLGHGEGDKVLQQVADYFRQVLQNEEFCSRWGGEEFLLVLPHCTLDQIYQRVQILCQELPNHIEIDNWQTPLTCSFGVVQLHLNESLLQAINRADQLLYQAKENGRYQVKFENSQYNSFEC